MGIASASIYACFGSKEALFRETVALYGTISGAHPRRALSEHPTARAAIHAMLRATADEVPGAPHGCMLSLAVPTGAIENSGVREFLAGLRRNMLGHHPRPARPRHRRRRPHGVTRQPRRHRPLLHHPRAGLSVQARDGSLSTPNA